MHNVTTARDNVIELYKGILPFWKGNSWSENPGVKEAGGVRGEGEGSEKRGGGNSEKIWENDNILRNVLQSKKEQRGREPTKRWREPRLINGYRKRDV